MNISKGTLISPAKIVIYGPAGIGKSTFASRFPSPLFLDIEGGTSRLDVSRVTGIDTLAKFTLTLEELKRDAQGFRTLVIDTADWLETLVAAKVCEAKGKQSLEDFPYKSGYNIVFEEWKRLMDVIGDMQRANKMNVVFCAHAVQRKIELPGEANAFDHYELKMLRKSGPILKEWSDFLLFLNYDVLVQTNSQGKSIGTGGKRCIYTAHSAIYDAKSRAKLPAKMLMDEGAIQKILGVITQPAPEPTHAPAPAPDPAPAPAPVPAETPFVESEAKAAANAGINHIKFLDLLHSAGISLEEAMATFIGAGVYPQGTRFEDIDDSRLAKTIAKFENFRKTVETRRNNG